MAILPTSGMYPFSPLPFMGEGLGERAGILSFGREPKGVRAECVEAHERPAGKKEVGDKLRPTRSKPVNPLIRADSV